MYMQPVMMQSADDFGGVERIVADEVLSQTQCQDLLELASVRIHTMPTLLHANQTYFASIYVHVECEGWVYHLNALVVLRREILIRFWESWYK